jgi:S1-C subfamily serine protease
LGGFLEDQQTPGLLTEVVRLEFSEDAMEKYGKIAVGLLLIAVATVTVRAEELRDIFQRVNPAVVVIKTKAKDVAPGRPGQLVTIGGLGSGVLISDRGEILTAAHVIQTADEIEVEFLSGETIPARVVGSDTTADVALIELEKMPKGVTPVKIGNSDDAFVGDEVFVVGAPYGIDHTLTVGHISGRRQPANVLKGLAPVEFFQTDAAVNQGNSGGPMFNQDGEVIAIVSYIISQSGGFEGIGFAGTSNMAKRLLLDSAAFWSGIDSFLLTEEMAGIFNVGQWGGILVQKVAKNSPAARLGLKGGSVPFKIEDFTLVVGGDIIVEAMGTRLDSPENLVKIRQQLNELSPAQLLKVKVLRGGKEIELSASWAQ